MLASYATVHKIWQFSLLVVPACEPTVRRIRRGGSTADGCEMLSIYRYRYDIMMVNTLTYHSLLLPYC
jgi:hypothetical protein